MGCVSPHLPESLDAICTAADPAISTATATAAPAISTATDTAAAAAAAASTASAILTLPNPAAAAAASPPSTPGSPLMYSSSSGLPGTQQQQQRSLYGSRSGPRSCQSVRLEVIHDGSA